MLQTFSFSFQDSSEWDQRIAGVRGRQKGDNSMAEKILVVEDEPEIAELIGVYLNSEGFQTIL